MSRSALRKNLIALYGVQGATLLLPLVTIPLLARALGPSALGELAAVQSLFATLGFLIEYGFSFSATRQVAIYRDDRQRLTTIFSDVVGAKVLLSVAFTIVTLIVYTFTPIFRTHPSLFWIGFLGALVQGFNLLWFYQGIERLSQAATIDVSLRLAYTCLVLLLVRSPADLVIVIALQSLTSLLSVAINTWRAIPLLNRLNVTWKGSYAALVEGRSMFFFRGITLFYTTANTAMLRFFFPAAVVAQYSTAEKLSAVSSSILSPVTQVLFPRLSHLVHHDFSEAQRFFRKSLLITVPITIFISIVAYYLAPIVISVLFGPAFLTSVSIFRILLINIVTVPISNLFGLQWMIPNGMEFQFNMIILAAAICNLIFIFNFVPTFGPFGMAWSLVVCEFLVAGSMFLVVLRSKKSPFSAIKGRK